MKTNILHKVLCACSIVSSIVLILAIIAALPALAGINTWTTNGPEGAIVRSFAFSPDYASDGTIFVGTHHNGVYRSTDRGASWVQINTGLTNTDVTDVAVSSNYISDTTVFAGTNYGGIYKSIDAGASWRQINNGLTNTIVTSLGISPDYAIDKTIFAGTAIGIFISTDEGASWTPAMIDLSYIEIRALAVSPDYATDATVFAAAAWIGGGALSGVYKSTNRGQNWILMDNGLPTGQFVSTVAISPNYARDKTVFASGPYVYKSTDAGVSWIRTGDGPYTGGIWSIAISPGFSNDRNLFVASTLYIHRSINGGAEWAQIYSTLPYSREWTREVALSPNYVNDRTVFIGTEGLGVYEYTLADILQLISASITFDPDTLNLTSQGRYATCYIELPHDYDVAEIDISSIALVCPNEASIPAQASPTAIGDHDSDGITDLMVKFDRASIQAEVEPAETVELSIAGRLDDGAPFEGLGAVRVINTGTGCSKVQLGKGIVAEFSNVSVEGFTGYKEAEVSQALPTGYKFIGGTLDIFTTAIFEKGSTVNITMPYSQSGNENNIKLFHWTDSGWEDCTTSVDTTNNKVTGQVTSLSPFALGYPVSPSGPVISTGYNTYWLCIMALAFLAAGLSFIRRKVIIND